MAELMKAAGFTHGAFYNHFPSKEALAAATANPLLSEEILNTSRRDLCG